MKLFLALALLCAVPSALGQGPAGPAGKGKCIIVQFEDQSCECVQENDPCFTFGGCTQNVDNILNDPACEMTNDAGNDDDGAHVVCPDYGPEEFCDCDGDCGSDLCACVEANADACCAGSACRMVQFTDDKSCECVRPDDPCFDDGGCILSEGPAGCANQAKSVNGEGDYVPRAQYNTLLAATAGLAGLVVGVAMTATVASRCSKGSDTSVGRRDDRTADMEMTVA